METIATSTIHPYAEIGKMGERAQLVTNIVCTDTSTTITRKRPLQSRAPRVQIQPKTRTAYEEQRPDRIMMVKIALARMLQSTIKPRRQHAQQLRQEPSWSHWPWNRDSPSSPPQGATGMILKIMKYQNAGGVMRRLTIWLATNVVQGYAHIAPVVVSYVLAMMRIAFTEEIQVLPTLTATTHYRLTMHRAMGNYHRQFQK